MDDLRTYQGWKRSGLRFVDYVQTGQRVEEELVQSVVDGSVAGDEAVSAFPLAYYKKAVSRIPESGPLYAKFKKKSGEWRLTGYDNEYAFVVDRKELISQNEVRNVEWSVIRNWLVACDEAYQKLNFESVELQKVLLNGYIFDGDISVFRQRENSEEELIPIKAYDGGLDDFEGFEDFESFSGRRPSLPSYSEKQHRQFEKDIERVLTKKEWEASGKSFLEIVKIGDPLEDFLVDDLVHRMPMSGFCTSVNILAYHRGESGLEPLRASFQTVSGYGLAYLRGFEAEDGKLFTTKDDLISPKEAIEAGLLDNEAMKKLMSSGHDEHYPITTLKDWKRIQKKSHMHYDCLIYDTTIGWCFDTEFVKYWTGQSNPKGEAIGKEDEGCVASREEDKFVPCKPLFKELYPGEWKLVGYIANGELYNKDEDIKEMGLINEKPSEVERRIQEGLAFQKEMKEHREREKQEDNNGELKKINAFQ